MEIIPAIDLINNHCVRLTEGNYSRKTEYNADPLNQAILFESYGFKRLHIVDLDGAKNARPVHMSVLREICSSTSLIVDFGGGVRTEEDVEEILLAGAKMVSLGSIAVRQPDTLEKWISLFGAEHFFIGADVIDTFIAAEAWQDKTTIPVSDFIRKWKGEGIKNFFSTDVRRDGKLEGPATELYTDLCSEFHDIKLVASGGVACLQDLTDLRISGVSGAIVGKAIYEQRITLEQLKNWI